MGRLLGLLRMFGNAGAVANAGTLATDRRREDWVVRTLERHVRPVSRPAPLRRTA